MDCVHAIGERPIDSSQVVAVLIGESGVDQRHIGIFHRSADSGSALLHLAWHCRLQNDAALPDYMKVWIAPRFTPRRLVQVAALCRRIWRKNDEGGIPYAFSNPSGAFDVATGEILLGPTQFGLTCASFVFAVFDAAGLKLAQYETWPVDRVGDQEWQEKIIALLEDKAEPAHIEHLRTEIGAVRYRPEEVAAASALAPPEAEFNEASSLGKQILEMLHDR